MSSPSGLLTSTALDANPFPAAGRVHIVASVDPDAVSSAAVPEVVGWLRLAGTSTCSPAWARRSYPGRLIYACTEPGGGVRRARLREAVDHCDLVELDADRDLTPEVLAAVPPARRIITWHGSVDGPRALADRFHGLAATAARCYRMVVGGGRIRDGVHALEFLRSVERRDVTAYAPGEDGLWSRVLACRHGAPFIFGSLEVGRDEPAVGRLIDDFGLPDAVAAGRLFGIVSGSAAKSLSPRLHNAGYRAAGLAAVYLPFSAASFAEFWAEFGTADLPARIGLPLHGLTIASPHKFAAAAAAHRRSPAVRGVGAANLLFQRHGEWVADSSDPTGVLRALAHRGVTARGRRAIVVGCGGSGCTIANALRQAGAAVTLANRGRRRGEEVAARMGLPHVPLSEFTPEGFDLMVNATPAGLGGDAPPFDIGRLSRGAVVVDLVYTDHPAPPAAGRSGVTVITGRDVLLHQAAYQFARMTGRALPTGVAARALGLPEPAGEGDSP